MPLVSVVTSTYDRAELLPAAIASVLGQRAVDLELIVVDNASTDRTPEVLAAIDDERLRVVRNETNLGGIGGRNAGIRAARGTWVAIHDDDDLWAPDKLRAQLDAAEAAGAGWATVGCVYIDGAGRITGGRPPLPADQLLAQLPLRYAIRGGISNVLWRRDLLDDGGQLDPRLTMTADWDLALRLARTGPPVVVHHPYLACRQHASNLSRRAADFQHELAVIEDKFADLLDGRSIDRGEQWRFVASESLRAGDRTAATRSYLRGIRAGDPGCVVRAPAVLTPRGLQPWLKRRLLSNPAWVDEAALWLASGPASPEVTVP